MRTPYRRVFDHGFDEWDDEQEDRDKKEARKAQEQSGSGRQQRVIKHPLFKPFNTTQAVEALRNQSRGECIIRPSSKGPDHLAVTWKIADGVYQHIDVVELDKENEFSVGRKLRIGGKLTYSDLDELIVLHVQAMAKKVDEMTNDEKYQNGTKEQTGKPCCTHPE
jgi:transcription elongation factor SPT6